MKSQILISVGSNIDKEANTATGIKSLIDTFDDVAVSTIYESESVGFQGENFLNLVVSAYTSDSVEQVCKILKAIEDKHGRIRDVKFGNRTLDLDLLTYSDAVCQAPVVLPRPEIEYNAFVLRPTADLVPQQKLPGTEQTYAQLWQAFIEDNPNKHQKLWPATMQWRIE